MQWTVNVAKPAHRALSRIQGPDHERIMATLVSMQAAPFGGDLKHLTNDPRAKYRRRVGSWRIFFDADAHERIIWVKAIERRTSKTY